MKLLADAPHRYLDADAIVDHETPAIRELAGSLRENTAGDPAFARVAFEYVRDQITHSWDAQDPRVTLSASEALAAGTGLCYAKAHLLAAILRAEGIPTGLCYQLLTDDGDNFMVHGLVAVYLDGAWHRQDPRGNKPGVDAQFSLTGEQLAWPTRREAGEVDYPEVRRTASPAVVAALRGASSLLELYRSGLPTSL